uniref:Uncharacterized protein n=1 Tax=Ananas comosus var. bracteatus TaxID=296719 RepID=A0A6V7QJG3_ANACO|nr:unnamed protein product [Ananas comosus var. bracteatus]
MATKLAFTEEEMAVDEGLGYPKAYAKLCRNPNILNPYNHGPPFTFLPYVLQPQESLRAKDLNQMFPILDPEAVPCVNPRGYVNLLWKQLDHLGNAGFDPALFRVDPFGNVLYLHADSASPLAWDIDHWFPCTILPTKIVGMNCRRGKTVPSNLRILQSQVCKKKKNKLEFLIPWWDLQLGISVSQFLSIFASRNSDFSRNRAFSFLFCDGGNEELSSLQAVESHAFPQHFSDVKKQVGLAPAAIVSTRRSDASVLKTLDINRSSRPNNYPLIAARKVSTEKDDTLTMAVQSYRPNISKENNNPDMDNYSNNPYLSIVMARDSLRQREEAKKKQAEMNELEGELSELKQKNEADRINIQELEALLIKRRRRVEKCRRLAEAQSSYKALLEKMIRDAMHQSVVYKEQLRLNQSATSALMARLEAQRAICDSSENELRRKFKLRDNIEKQIKPFSEQARKRSRIDDNLIEERDDESIELLSTRRIMNPLKKELRKFLEEEQKASEAGRSLCEDSEEVLDETSTSGEGENSEAYRVLKYEKNDPSEKTKFKGLCVKEESYSNSVGLKGRNSSHQSQKEEAETYGSGFSVREKLEKLTIKEGTSSKTNEIKEITFPQSPFVCTENTRHGKPGEAKEEASLLHGKTRQSRKSNSVPQSPRRDDEEYMKQVGKGNVEKWVRMLMENSQEGTSTNSLLDNQGKQQICIGETIDKMNSFNQQEEKNSFDKNSNEEQIKDKNCRENNRKEVLGGRKSFDIKEREEKNAGNPRSESARGFRSFPSSPSMILGMRRGVDCMGRKPKVIGDDDEYGDENSLPTINSKFIKSCSKAIKKAVNI